MKFEDLYKSIINKNYVTEGEADNLDDKNRVEGSFQSDMWNAEKAKEKAAMSATPAAPQGTEGELSDLPDDVKKLLQTMKEALAKGARFASFMYKTNGTADVKKGQAPNGPTKIYKVNLGVSYTNIKDHNKAVIEKYEPKDAWEARAKEEMLASLSKPYVAGEPTGNVYVRLGKGIRYNTAKQCLNILGQVTGKAEVVAPGEEKPKDTYPFKLSVNKDGTPRGGDKAHIALAKKNINHELRYELRGGITSYDLDLNKIAGVRVSGDVIEFHADGNQSLRDE